MKDIIILLALAFSASSVIGACNSNWITTKFGINTLTTSIRGNNTFPTCGTIRSGKYSCCSHTEIDTFQAKADALVVELQTAFAARDQLILDSRGNLIALKDVLDSIHSSFAILDKESRFPPWMIIFADMVNVFSQHFSTLKANFITYQQSRATCFNTLIKAQVSVWCSACLEDPSINGFDVESSTVEYGRVFEDALTDACSGYINGAIEQSSNIFLDYMSDYLSILDSSWKKLVDGDSSAANQDFGQFLTGVFRNPPPPKNEWIAFPVGTCIPTNCSWIRETLFVKGILDKDFAVLGGSNYFTLSFSRRLQGVPTDRMLHSINVNPEVEAAGIIVNFPVNPGNVDNDQNGIEEEIPEGEEIGEDSIEDTNSAFRNGAVVGVITALITLF